MPTPFLSLLFFSVIGMAFLNGCSSDSAVASAAKSAFTLSSARVWLEKVKFKISADVNNNAPVTVHLLIVYDQDAFGKFSTLSADLYFKDQKQYKKDFETGKVDFFSWEVVPGQNLSDQPVAPSKVSGLGAIVFARYSSPGDHRAILGEDRTILVNLEKLDFSVTPVN